jgi:hypothetical protein
MKEENEENKENIDFDIFLQQFKYMKVKDKDKKKLSIHNEYILTYPKSTSLFKKIHHNNMNIIIRNIYNKEHFINIKKSLYFYKNSSVNEVLKYYKTLTNNFAEIQCSRYVNKLKEIIKNTENKKSHESIVDDFVRILFQISGIDNGKTLNIESQYKLYLNIGSNKIPSTPDLICKTNKDIIWMVEESKHINNSTYLEGDLQVICHILSAFQYNEKYTKKKHKPKTIYGFKMKNTKCFFYKINMFNNYMKFLINGKFDKSIFVYKYPEKGIDINPYNINSYENIKEVFTILYNLKCKITP